jgi:hypothetical protein
MLNSLFIISVEYMQYDFLKVFNSKSNVLWDVSPDSLAYRYHLSGGFCCLHLQARRRRQVSLKCYVGFEVLTALVMKSSSLWDITPCSPLEVNWRFGGTELCLLPVSCWFLASLIPRPSSCSSETLVDFQRTTRRYIPEYRIVHDVMS